MIKDTSEAHAFIMHMNLPLQNKPHWQLARQALGQLSEDSGLKALHPFRDAATAEGWLAD
jgi:hypothetical protein